MPKSVFKEYTSVFKALVKEKYLVVFKDSGVFKDFEHDIFEDSPVFTVCHSAVSTVILFEELAST